MLNKKIFYDEVRKNFRLNSEKQIEGFEAIIEEARKRQIPLTWLAYILATAWHETAHRMQPVTEFGSQKYLRSKKYWPYIGRGFVQITWKENYAKYGIADTPEKALEMDTAIYIMFDGMIKGIFTGKKLADYFHLNRADWRGARRIINGMDRADLIGGYGKMFYNALVKATKDERTETD